ncbi:MAG: Response regulator receiver domain [Pseudomonadota bacterium]|jgi:CheY-like chemotaxis protein
MAKILLLDDSPTMHRVVRLTFADDQRLEIAVARTRAEADQTLSMQPPELIIAYVRFDGLTDPRYFQTLRMVTSRVLLLAESEENLDQFARAGFDRVLRKPFHSDELRQVVEEMLNQDGPTVEYSVASPQAGDAIEQPSFRLSELPTIPPPSSLSPQRATQISQPRSNPPEQAMAQPSLLDSNTRPGGSASSSAGGENLLPQITLDLSEFQKSLESNPVMANRPAMQPPPQSMIVRNHDEQESQPLSQFPADEITISQASWRPGKENKEGVRSSQRLSPPPPPPPPPPPRSIEPQIASVPRAIEPPPRSFEPQRASGPRVIEPALPINEPFEVEQVVLTSINGAFQSGRSGERAAGAASVSSVAPRPIEQIGLSRQDVEKIVGDSIAVAVNNAVRQALTETLPDLRLALVNEVSQRAVDQLTDEIIKVKRTLREQMIEEIRDVSAQWLKRETPGLAKDVIREEIRRVIEQM